MQYLQTSWPCLMRSELEIKKHYNVRNCGLDSPVQREYPFGQHSTSLSHAIAAECEL